MGKEFIYDLAGTDLKIKTGKVAQQANGSCIVEYGETTILVTATASKEPRDGIGFFPLSVNYEERLYSVGKIPGGFIKREGRPSDKAVLTSRLIDRPLRPLFPEGYRNDVQIIATVLSVDLDHSPDIAAMIGSSIALDISDIPFMGPTGSVSVGRIDGEFVLCPNVKEREESDLYLVVAGTKDAIMMVEAEGNEIPEDVMLEGILFAHKEIQKICDFIQEIKDEIGKEKSEYEIFKPAKEVVEKVRELYFESISDALKTKEKTEREDKLAQLESRFEEDFGEDYEELSKDIETAFSNLVEEETRRMILEDGIRPDFRDEDEIRQITSEVGILPRTHGSGLFTRGETQVLTVATLGASSDVQIIDGLGKEDSKRYMHHYNFPPFSVGDTRPVRGPGRREIGHGALAEKALEPVIPSEEEFPYTIRLVSEVLGSNGSSSQASVCGSTLALLDAGVPIKAPVAGITMGLVKDDKNLRILTDIQGLEDHLGDMDFKIAGTRDGITAIQMDIKIAGVEKEILSEALEAARKGRLFILDKMEETISEPREELSKHAPRIITMEVDPEKIRDIIGPGGKMINKIIDETGVKIDIEDDGFVSIAADDVEAGERAEELIEMIVKEVEAGEVYLGKVVKLVPFGAFVEVLPGKEGLVHISNVAHERIDKVEDVLDIGDEILVKVTEIDRQGRINLSRKAMIPKEEKDNKKS